MNNLISQEHLESLKAQHGKVYVIGFNHQTISEEVSEYIADAIKPNPDYDPEYPTCDFAFKKMDFDQFAASATLAMEKPIHGIRMQMETTLIWGDKDLLSDPTVINSISPEFAKITKARSASLKKN